MKTLVTLWIMSVCAAAQAAPTQAAQSRAQSAVGADDDDPKSTPQPATPNGPRPAPAARPTQPPGTERDLTGDDRELPPLRVQAPPAGMVEVRPEPVDTDNELTRPAPPRPQKRFRPWVTAVVIISVASAAGLAIGLGVGLSNKSDHSTAPLGSLGTIHY